MQFARDPRPHWYRVVARVRVVKEVTVVTQQQQPQGAVQLGVPELEHGATEELLPRTRGVGPMSAAATNLVYAALAGRTIKHGDIERHEARTRLLDSGGWGVHPGLAG